MNTKLKASRSRKKLKFGIDRQVAFGFTAIRICFSNNTVLIEQVDDGNTDVPSLFNLDFLDKYRIYVNNVSSHLVGEVLNIKLQISQKRGHLYLDWSEWENSLHEEWALNIPPQILLSFIWQTFQFI